MSGARGATRARSRRQDIVDAAAALFARQGYSATSMQSIADEVGMLKGSLYHHFASKEEILFEMTREPLGGLVTEARRIGRLRASAPEKIRLLIAQHLRALHDSHPHLGVITAERDESLPEGMRGDVVALRRAYQAEAENIFREGQATGQLRADRSPTIVVNLALGSVNWMHRWYDPAGPLGPDELADILSSMVLDGLIAEGST